MARLHARNVLRGARDSRLIMFGVLPVLLYFLCFIIFTFPAIFQVSSHFYGDNLDGAISLWNIWDMRTSLAALQSPFHTSMLHFPEGTTLTGHPLSPVNSLAGAGLSLFMNLYESANLLVIVSFVASGLGAFLLCYHFSGSYRASLIGGFILAFSGYQLLHIGSHVYLTSLEWLALFLLFWHKLLLRPSIKYALIASLFLILDTYTNLYYLYYAAIAGFVMLIVVLVKQRPEFMATRRHAVSLAVFSATFLLAVAPFLISFGMDQKSDPFLDAHDPHAFSVDVLGPLMPGPLKGWYGQQLEIGEGDGQNFIGVTILALIAYAIVRRKKLRAEGRFPSEWLAIFVIALLLSLGPVLHVVNHAYNFPLMPYALLDRLLPSLSVAGMPERFMALAMLAAAVIAAIALADISRRRLGTILMIVIFALIAIESIPVMRLHPQQPNIPAYVYVIRDLPDKGAVYDYTHGLDLIYQTIEEHPIYGGYIGRRPASVVREDDIIQRDFDTGDYQKLCDLGFRYAVIDSYKEIKGARLVFDDTAAGKRLYDLSAFSLACRAELS